MKHILQYTMGHLGYFIIGYMALRVMIIQDDKVGFTILVVGSFLLVGYVQFLEKRHGTPKYSGYIKLILVIVFLISSFIMLI
ncbi:MAG: hypothetical protein ACQEWU_20310 [Bacillota bacterium]|uniref:Uncharacterized protein n=1 Tax=Virgibacillus salarius TaxID=447199 RepID=A0A941DTN4_9BACI|nr:MULTISPECIES: hypothetical protein [Bacillaceae]NAZ07659.1 hypothetical protein [Agaribacter marinus]MBR7794939.1 hypothetical protein [Virgibacillus salarius]MCC2252715.1 hypothetical protein [Virgibacillus sp. AGTR]MDY7045051.1 hypothetical protein [Virgibacillus sp. M23]QRZ18774.1 hypothetical protein JUJ52_03245 [Virgibacillus sp. AGTR]